MTSGSTRRNIPFEFTIWSLRLSSDQDKHNAGVSGMGDDDGSSYVASMNADGVGGTLY